MKSKSKRGRPPKKLSIKGAYNLLINQESLITTKEIDAMAKTIESGCFIKEACILNGVSDYLINRIRLQKTDLAAYLNNAIKIAQAKAYKKLTEEWLDAQSSPHQKKHIQDFLILTTPSFSKRYYRELNYNVELLLSTVEKKVSPELFIDILRDISNIDQDILLTQYDTKEIGDQ